MKSVLPIPAAETIERPEKRERRKEARPGELLAAALDLFVEHGPSFMSHLLLSHLSKENNDEDLVKKIFTEKAKNTIVKIASRYHPTNVYTITHQNEIENTVPKNATQMSIF